jgi:hypothetical protein
MEWTASCSILHNKLQFLMSWQFLMFWKAGLVRKPQPHFPIQVLIERESLKLLAVTWYSGRFSCRFGITLQAASSSKKRGVSSPTRAVGRSTFPAGGS